METQQQKPTSRFSTLNVFGKFSSSSKPPPPPPKDQWYLQAKANASCVSFSSNVSAVMMGVAASSSSHSSSTSRNVAIPPTTIGVSSPSRNLSPVSQFGVTASQSQYNLSLPRTISPTPSTSASSISMTLSSAASASTISLNTTNTQTSTAGSTFRRGLSKLGALGKRPFFGKVGLSKGARQWEIDQERVGNGTGSPRLGSEEDESISRPYDVHVSVAFLLSLLFFSSCSLYFGGPVLAHHRCTSISLCIHWSRLAVASDDRELFSRWMSRVLVFSPPLLHAWTVIVAVRVLVVP